MKGDNLSRHWTVFKLIDAGALYPVSDFHPDKIDALEWVADNGEQHDTYYVMRAVYVEYSSA